MTASEHFRSVSVYDRYERFRSFVAYLRRSTGIRIINIYGKKMSINAKERHETIENAHKTLRNAQERSGTVNGQECLGSSRNAVTL
jgi:hypothetical protein